MDSTVSAFFSATWLDFSNNNISGTLPLLGQYIVTTPRLPITAMASSFPGSTVDVTFQSTPQFNLVQLDLAGNNNVGTSVVRVSLVEGRSCVVFLRDM